MRYAVLCLVLSGCASMISSNPPPPGWPKLEVRIHKASGFEVAWRCSKYLTPVWKVLSLGLAGGCAEVNFANVRCDIWVPHDVDPGVLEHEMDHCFGKDHPGDSTLRDAWLAYRTGA